MTPAELKFLSLRELENLITMQEKILEWTVRFESDLLEEDSRRRLESVRDNALDLLFLLKAEFKKRTL